MRKSIVIALLVGIIGLNLLPLAALADGPYLPPANGVVLHYSDDQVTAHAIGLNYPMPQKAVVLDCTGNYPLIPSMLNHAYGYTGSQLTTDTVTNGTYTWVKTYTYTGSNLTGESCWSKQ